MSLVELMAVVGIIGILTKVGSVGYQSFQRRAARAATLTQLDADAKQVMGALLSTDQLPAMPETVFGGPSGFTATALNLPTSGSTKFTFTACSLGGEALFFARSPAGWSGCAAADVVIAAAAIRGGTIVGPCLLNDGVDTCTAAPGPNSAACAASIGATDCSNPNFAPTPMPTSPPPPTTVPTSVPTATPVPPATNTAVPTFTPVVTPTRTNTVTPTPMPTATPNPTSTNTSTPLPTNTSTPIPPPTATSTSTFTATPTPTPTLTLTPTNTPQSGHQYYRLKVLSIGGNPGYLIANNVKFYENGSSSPLANAMTSANTGTVGSYSPTISESSALNGVYFGWKAFQSSGTGYWVSNLNTFNTSGNYDVANGTGEWIQLNFGSGRPVLTGYQVDISTYGITYGCDHIVMEWSDNGANWTTITQSDGTFAPNPVQQKNWVAGGSGTPVPTATPIPTATLAPTNTPQSGHQYYRLKALSLGGTAGYLIATNVKLYQNGSGTPLINAMTAANTGSIGGYSPTISESSARDGFYYGWKAFQNNGSGYWVSNFSSFSTVGNYDVANGTGEWIQLNFGSGRPILTGYQVDSSAFDFQYSGDHWVMEWSDNGSSWSTITQSDGTFTSNTQQKGW